MLGFGREKDKLEKTLGGIKNMDALPTAVFLIDVGHEEIAVREARKLGIPVVAVVDTNCSPEGIDYPIPGNDDAMRAIQLYAEGIADAVIDGKASIPEVPTGDDEFVELDESGKPKVEAKAAAAKPPPKKRARVTKVRAKGPAAARRGSARRRRRGRTRDRTRLRDGRKRAPGMEIKPALVKELRERTGAGMMECKKALGRNQRRHRPRGRVVAQGRCRQGRQEGFARRGGRSRRDPQRREGGPARRARGQLGDGLRRQGR